MLKGKTAMVTGGGSGIGLAIAEILIKNGAAVCITGRTKAKLDGALEKLKKMCGKAFAVGMDVGDHQSVAEGFKAFDAGCDRLDILVNNAGIREVKNLLDITPEEWQSVININLNGTFYCSREAALRMKKSAWGSIVNIASVSGLIGVTHRPAYNASKHGVIGLSKNMAKDLAPYNIRVNVIAPGVIRTELTEAYYSDQAFLDGVNFTVPLGAKGGVEDVAEAALFMASPKSGFITGTVLPVDGGWLAEKSFVTSAGASSFTSSAASSVK